MAKVKNIYVCNQCGYETAKWMGKCPDCGEWNSFEEQLSTQSGPKGRGGSVVFGSKPYTLKQIEDIQEERMPTGLTELDRVLSGGVVPGSLTLVGGDPGIGKSTLLLQLSDFAAQKEKVLYVSGEESVQQIKMRAARLAIDTEQLYLLAETNMEAILQTAKEMMPKLLVIDSIQTMFRQDVSSAPGSVTQVRECTSQIMRLGKETGISIFIVGHVTKEGAIAGPRVLEHMVDTVLYFEGERHASYRLLRAVKNRFGATNEIGVFEMQSKGLVNVQNPSAYMLSGRPFHVSGSVVTCSMEGTRPVLAEVQALISQSNYGQARRQANGMDYNRAMLLIAVLEKRIGMGLGNYDCYISIAGGIRIVEPALDAAVLSTVASSFKNKIIDPYTIIFGEVGLTGEIRAVTHAGQRIAEAEKLGFKRCLIPHENAKKLEKSTMEVYGIKNVSALLEFIF